MTRTTDAQWSLFHWNPELLGLGRQIGQINSGAFGIFLVEVSVSILVPSLVHVFHYSTIHIPNIWDVDSWIMENMDKGWYQNGYWYFDQKYPKCSRIYLPNLSAQPQKFWISMKKASLGVRSPCHYSSCFVGERIDLDFHVVYILFIHESLLSTF